MPSKKTKKEYEKLLKRLEKLILTNVFKPRQRLIESEVASMLDTSRTWVRDALKELSSRGLVQIIPHKGALVSDLEAKEIEDLFTIRLHLENLAVKLALQNINKTNIEELKEISYNFEDSCNENDIEQMIKYNMKFHDYIFSLSNNQFIVLYISNVRDRLHVARYFHWSSYERAIESAKEHAQMIKALEKKDLKKLYELGEKHLEKSKKSYLAQLFKNISEFEK